MSVKKRRRLRLITHADVASFNAAAKRISKADRMQKMGVRNMKYQLIYSMEKLKPSTRAQCDTRSASHAVPAEVVAALNGNNMRKE